MDIVAGRTICLGLARTVLVHVGKAPIFTLKDVLLWTVGYTLAPDVVVCKHVCRFFDTLNHQEVCVPSPWKRMGFCDCLDEWYVTAENPVRSLAIQELRAEGTRWRDQRAEPEVPEKPPLLGSSRSRHQTYE